MRDTPDSTAPDSDTPDTVAPLRTRTVRRAQLDWKGELTLAVLPTFTVLLSLAFVSALTEQPVLFASLASSAFLIYLDPEHPTNSLRTLVIAQLGAAGIGWLVQALVPWSYVAAAAALLGVIVLMIALDALHPPAVATALSFAFRSGPTSNVDVFVLAVLVTAALIVLERLSLRLLAHLAPHHG